MILNVLRGLLIRKVLMIQTIPVIDPALEHAFFDSTFFYKAVLHGSQQFVEHIHRLMDEGDAKIGNFLIIHALYLFCIVFLYLLTSSILSHLLVSGMEIAPLLQIAHTQVVLVVIAREKELQAAVLKNRRKRRRVLSPDLILHREQVNIQVLVVIAELSAGANAEVVRPLDMVDGKPSLVETEQTFFGPNEAYYYLDDIYKPYNTTGYLTLSTDVSGVETVAVESGRTDQIFDLQGRRVLRPEKGIYIVNGKKMVIR